MTNNLHFPFRPISESDLMVAQITAAHPVQPPKAAGPFIIGVAGGPAAGKAKLCKSIMSAIQDAGLHKKVVHIRLEDFYKPLSSHQISLDALDQYNFDHPDALDLDLFYECLSKISKGVPVDLPIYDFKERKRLSKTQRIESPDVVIISGILILYQRSIRELIDLKVFADVDSDNRLARQVIRDTEERYNFPLERVLQRYIKLIKPSFEEFILPSKKFADVIIPRGDANTVAVSLLTHHIVDLVSDRSNMANNDRNVTDRMAQVADETAVMGLTS